MKKSRSSVPLFAATFEPCAPPVRNEGLLATAGRPEPLPPPPAPDLEAMAVGKTKDGASLPAKPGVGRLDLVRFRSDRGTNLALRSQCRYLSVSACVVFLGVDVLVHDNGWGLGRHGGWWVVCVAAARGWGIGKQSREAQTDFTSLPAMRQVLL
jgi:hypothetical protein